MSIKGFLKTQAWLPVLLGVTIGFVLYMIGENDDAPGLVLIGFVTAIVLVFVGIYNAATSIKKGMIPAVLCFLLSAFGICWTIVLYNEGEFSDSPGILIFAGLICIGLIIVGIRFLKNTRQK